MSKAFLYGPLRLVLGSLVLASGIGKALDLVGFAEVIATYRLGLPEEFLWPVALGVSALELVLGAWLLTGWRLREAARLSMALNAGYFVLLTSALWRGLKLNNCGCFGVFLARPLRWYSPLEDAVLILVSYLLFRSARKEP